MKVTEKFDIVTYFSAPYNSWPDPWYIAVIKDQGIINLVSYLISINRLGKLLHTGKVCCNFNDYPYN